MSKSFFTKVEDRGLWRFTVELPYNLNTRLSAMADFYGTSKRKVVTIALDSWLTNMEGEIRRKPKKTPKHELILQ